jgi:hypothetical protein
LISCHQNHIQVDDLEEQVLERKLSCTTIAYINTKLLHQQQQQQQLGQVVKSV